MELVDRGGTKGVVGEDHDVACCITRGGEHDAEADGAELIGGPADGGDAGSGSEELLQVRELVSALLQAGRLEEEDCGRQDAREELGAGGISGSFGLDSRGKRSGDPEAEVEVPGGRGGQEKAAAGDHHGDEGASPTGHGVDEPAVTPLAAELLRGRPGGPGPEDGAAEDGEAGRHEGHRHGEPDEDGERHARSERAEGANPGHEHGKASGCHGQAGYQDDRSELGRAPTGALQPAVATAQTITHPREEEDAVVGHDAEQQRGDHRLDLAGDVEAELLAGPPGDADDDAQREPDRHHRQQGGPDDR